MTRSIRTRVTFAIVAIAALTSIASLPTAILYFERRLSTLPPDTQAEVDAVFTSNVPADFDGLTELAIAMTIMISVGVIVGVLLTRRPARTIQSVASAARAISTGDLEARAGGDLRRSSRRRPADDLTRLAHDFDDMAANLERLERERRTSSASIAHELRTPVSVLRARLQAVRDGVLPIDDGELGLLIDHVDALDRVIEDLRVLSLHHAGRLSLTFARVDLVDLARRTAAGFDDRADITVTAPPGGVTVTADHDRLRQAIANLLGNACRHAGDRPHIELHIDRDQATEVATIDVADDGPGFSDAQLTGVAVATVPTTHPDGSGLGLAIVGVIAAAHGGALTLRNRDGGGASARLTIADRDR